MGVKQDNEGHPFPLGITCGVTRLDLLRDFLGARQIIIDQISLLSYNFEVQSSYFY